MISSLRRAWRYRYFQMRAPDMLPFVDMGLGIEARYERCKDAWITHLERSKDFQRRALSEYASPGGKIIVLGAGRLLDIALPELFTYSVCPRFVDADGSAKGVAIRRLKGRTFQYDVEEITGVLSNWTTRLREIAASKNKEKVKDFLASLSYEVAHHLSICEEVVYSVNLLSQIPLYWRDVVHEHLSRCFGVTGDNYGRLPQPFEDLVKRSMAELQRGHLAALAQSRARLLVLITDEIFEYYSAQESFYREDALLVPIELSQFTKVMEDCWTWEISPQGIEERDFGIRHRVRALAFLRHAPER